MVPMWASKGSIRSKPGLPCRPPPCQLVTLTRMDSNTLFFIQIIRAPASFFVSAGKDCCCFQDADEEVHGLGMSGSGWKPP